MSSKQEPVKVPPTRGEPEPAPEKHTPAPEKPVVKEKPKRGDPWQERCPVCGLLGCRRHT